VKLTEPEIKRSLNCLVILLLGFLNFNLFGGELLTRIETELSQLIDIAKPSVVSITSTVAYQINSTEESSVFPFWGKKNSPAQTLKFHNISSGLILDQNGHIVTKSSVVKHSENIEVTLYNHQTHKAHFIGLDAETGLAVIKIDDVKLTPAKLGEDSDIRIGKWVAILGNSVGVNTSVTLGIINGIREENDLIQLSALINPGNSGSPIFNTDGEVIGIVAARINSGSITLGSTTPFQSFEGAVAYPVKIIHAVTQNLIHQKDAKRPWLGISTQDLSVGSVLITQVVENSPAQKAGLLVDDVVLAISNFKIQTSSELKTFLKTVQCDSALVFSVMRGNQILAFQITPEKWPANEPAGDDSPGFDYYLNSVSFKNNGYMQLEGLPETDALEVLRLKILKLEDDISNLKKQVQK
jgi:serine protease Do